MNNRLQRWGERALGQVRSVSPRIASRFEPELGVSLFEEEGGFQEIEAETPGRTQPRRIVSAEPVETSEPPSPQPNYATEQPAPVRVVKEAVPPPAATEPPSSQPRDSKPLAPRTIIAEPASVPHEPQRRQRRQLQPRESSASASAEPPPPLRILTETSLVRLKRFEEWMATPPREKPSPPKPAGTPPPTPVPLPARLRTEARAPAPAQLPPTAQAAPPPAPPAPIVVSIGTIVVRANPSMLPKPVAAPPADGLAAFLARRTAGQP